MNPNNGIVVVAGGTGRTGYFIVNELLKAGFKIRLITRNRRAAEETFKEKLIDMESIFECDLFQETKQQKSKLDANKEVKSILDLAFEPNRKGDKVQAFISALSVDLKSNDDSKILEETSIKLLVGLCKKHKVEQFVLVSSCMITHPYKFSTFLTNTLERNTIANKVGAENELRASGLNYTIIRPGTLQGDKDKQNKETNYTIAQGGQLCGSINRATVGKVVVQSLMDAHLAKKVTFECVSTAQQLSEEYRTFEGKDLKGDTENTIIRPNHQGASQTYKFLFLSAIALTSSLAYKMIFSH